MEVEKDERETLTTAKGS